jgi:hypothetical protein
VWAPAVTVRGSAREAVVGMEMVAAAYAVATVAKVAAVGVA